MEGEAGRVKRTGLIPGGGGRFWFGEDPFSWGNNLLYRGLQGLPAI